LSYFQSYFSLLQVLPKSTWVLSFNLSWGLCKLFTNPCKAFSVITFNHYHKLASILPKSSRFHWFKKFTINYLQYFNTTFKIHIESHSFYFHIHEPIIRFNISSSGNIYNCWDQNHGLLPKCPYIQMKTILILCSKIHILILNLTSKNTHSSFN